MGTAIAASAIAAAIAASSTLAIAVSGEGAVCASKAQRDNYLNVLRAGGSDYPVAILQRAGLDMTKPEPYRELVRSFGETIDRIEALL